MGGPLKGVEEVKPPVTAYIRLWAYLLGYGLWAGSRPATLWRFDVYDGGPGIYRVLVLGAMSRRGTLYRVYWAADGRLGDWLGLNMALPK